MAAAKHVLTSVRLALCPVSDRDVAALHRHWTDPDVRRYLWDDVIITRARVEDIVARSVRLFAVQGCGLWAVRLRDSDVLLGCGGYWEFHDPPRRELVLSLSPAQWGQGLALEAASLLLRYAFHELGFREVNASTDAPNGASLRLIERLGFRRTHQSDANGFATVFFTLPSSGYEPSRARTT